MILRRDKIFEGMVDVYDYTAEEHIRRKKTLRVLIGQEFMDLDWRRLKKPEKKTGPYQSKWKAGQTYMLYSYKWIPQTEDVDYSRPETIKYTYKN